MQIDDGRLLGWLWDGLAALAGLVGILLMFIWRGDRARLKIVEEKVAHAITKPEVDVIVRDVKDEFKDDHKTIIQQVRSSNDELRTELRDLRREIIQVIKQPWNGHERRGE